MVGCVASIQGRERFLALLHLHLLLLLPIIALRDNRPHESLDPSFQSCYAGAVGVVVQPSGRADERLSG